MFLLLASHAHAHSGPAVPPPNRLTDWASPLVVEDTGSRLMMIVEASDTVPVRIEARVGESWVGLEELWHEGSLSVFRLDLASTDAVSLRSSDQERIVALDWDLFEPGTPEPRLEGVAPPSPGVLPAELVDIGVISRSDWGAQSTTCTSTENDWYRMAVHHTAGSQTSGGSVQGAVKSLQSYALGTGTYCDIPYQFLVGYDGSLWEGRPYDYYSGATGGGNNDGNSAVSFLGCYHPEPGCGTAHAATDAMMDAGQLLIQTFSALHGIETTDEYIRGHQDWPGNSTACPGDYILARFDELLEPLGPDYAAEIVQLSCEETTLEVGQTTTCSAVLKNVGGKSWSTDNTLLAPLPRDEASPLANDTWLSSSRITGPDAATAAGSTGTFSFELQGETVGDYELSLTLLEEWVTWFADDGGPVEGSMVLDVRVVREEIPDSEDSEAATDDSAPPTAGFVPPPGPREEMAVGCGCGSRPGPSGLVGALGALMLGLLRRGAQRAESSQ